MADSSQMLILESWGSALACLSLAVQSESWCADSTALWTGKGMVGWLVSWCFEPNQPQRITLHQGWKKTSIYLEVSHFTSHYTASLFFLYPWMGGRGCLMSHPSPESQGCHLIPLYYLLSLVLLPSPINSFLSFFLPAGPFSWTLSRKFFNKRWPFLYGSCLAARRSKLVDGMCNMLPYGSGIFCYA